MIDILSGSYSCCKAYPSGRFPKVVIEAKSAGTPYVVSGVGNASVIAAEAGFMMQPADSLAISKAIEQYSQVPVASRWQPRIEAKQWVTKERAIEISINRFDNPSNLVLCDQEF